MNGVQDFMNAAKYRRGPAGGAGDSKDGAAGMGHGGAGGSNMAGGKSGLGGIANAFNIEDTVPYCAKDVSIIELILAIDILLYMQGEI